MYTYNHYDANIYKTRVFRLRDFREVYFLFDLKYKIANRPNICFRRKCGLHINSLPRWPNMFNGNWYGSSSLCNLHVSMSPEAGAHQRSNVGQRSRPNDNTTLRHKQHNLSQLVPFNEGRLHYGLRSGNQTCRPLPRLRFVSNLHRYDIKASIFVHKILTFDAVLKTFTSKV